MSNAPLPLRKVHHIELWVGNAKQAEYYYRKAYGFSRLAYSGPETGVRDRVSYVMAQNKIRLVLTSTLLPEGEIADHVKKHGDGVRDVAFETSDARLCHAEATARGAKDNKAPWTEKDDTGTVTYSRIHTYGDTVHSFIDKSEYKGVFLPGFREDRIDEPGIGLLIVDHVVGNQGDHEMETWVNFYDKVFGFSRFASFDDKDISTEFSALRSVVMAAPNNVIKMPLNEPAPGKRKSQIQEYVESYGGAGVQHLALLTNDITATIVEMRKRAVDFLEVPDTYYTDLLDRVGPIDEDISVLRKLKILVDRDDKGYLLQLFSQPVQDRPTLFFEIIQRKGSDSFGKGNFKALFESIERAQAARGNL
ncbi:MAG: 4-hydroxyphenylpyruvate dioxygenase [Calditrichaeota bacterium]|nr:4-hydroxyphenylpyruvate dioxygenase [Candidatus Cloacimonadota bacterium]MCB1046724.1 4-hydroxyphenylpyruvate dioxygenase [Calditrichota bacterium]